MTIHSDQGIKPSVTVRDQDRVLHFEGREAWALQHLLRAGARGVTPLERPAPRWSHYVHQLRQEGLDIETVREPHGGTHSGHHGRYVLHTPLLIMEAVHAD